MITERAVLGMFYEQLQQDIAMSLLNDICTPVIKSDQDSEEYDWLGHVPQLAALLGEKKYAQLREFAWTVRNSKFQGGLKFPKNHILYDKTGQVLIRLNELAKRSNSHWWNLAAALIAAGASTACYDGQYYYDTDHSEGDSGTQSNSINVDISTLPVSVAGTTTNPSVSEMLYSIFAGIEQILSFKDDKGEYVNENMTEFRVLVPLTLLTNAVAAVKQTRVDGGDSNLIIDADGFKISVSASPRLSSWTASFALFATQGMQKPIIRQQRIPNNYGSLLTPDGMELQTIWVGSEHYKKHDECLLSIETERAVAYGDWKKTCLVTMT